MLTTKRRVIAQVLVCQGCCGQTERGRPTVPAEWLKQEWRKADSDLESRLNDAQRRLERRIFDLEMRIPMYICWGAMIAITLFFMLLSIANR